jgi:predicted cupin superfamily sugar epimerase
MTHSTDPDQIIAKLQLQPHPEGGWYREMWRDTPADGGRGAGTAIYFLLRAGERSHWHRVTDAAEIWHWYAGEPLDLSISDGAQTSTVRLGPSVLTGEVPQAIVPANAWQAASPTGAWTLVGCTVSPAFEFAAFELAAPDWKPADV